MAASDLGQSDSHRFIAARSIIRRMLEDWPYQPPEVIEAERDGIRRWLDETNPSSEEYIAAMHEEAGRHA